MKGWSKDIQLLISSCWAARGLNDTFFVTCGKEKIICYSQILYPDFYLMSSQFPITSDQTFFKTMSEDNSRSSEESAQKETVADPAKKASCNFKQNFLLPILFLCIKPCFWESLKVLSARACCYSKAEFFVFTSGRSWAHIMNLLYRTTLRKS